MGDDCLRRGKVPCVMSDSPRDIEVEMTDCRGWSLSEIDALDVICFTRSLARILTAERDPTDPLYGGDTPEPDREQL